MSLTIRPIELTDANDFIGRLHRHHERVVSHRFSVSCWDGERLCGVATCGRPVARMTNQLEVLEVTRLCTDGTPHSCSCLYAACARAGKAIGYLKIQTFILETEPGTSLKAAGWECESHTAGGGAWNHSRDNEMLWGKAGRSVEYPTCGKQRWAKTLNERMAVPA